MIGAFGQVIASLISSLSMMDDRLKEIESRQRILEEALRDSQEDIMKRIDDVNRELWKKLKKKKTTLICSYYLYFIYAYLSCCLYIYSICAW